MIKLCRLAQTAFSANAGMEFALLIKRDANNEKNIPSKYLSLYSSQLKQMVRVRTNASSINLMIKELMISVMSFTIRKLESLIMIRMMKRFVN